MVFENLLLGHNLLYLNKGLSSISLFKDKFCVRFENTKLIDIGVFEVLKRCSVLGVSIVTLETVFILVPCVIYTYRVGCTGVFEMPDR
jgi:hypothetical protein